MVGIVVAILSVISLAVGFVVGLTVYSHLYAHFLAAIEQRCARRASIDRQKQTLDRAILDQTKSRLIAQYGNDLSQRHQEIVDEELAAVLSKPQNGERNG